MKIRDCIFLDHHSTTPVDPIVLDKMLPHFADSFGNPHSAEHAFGWAAMRAVEESAAQVASMLGGDPDELVFTSGATEANNLAILGVASGPLARDRRTILVASTDHKSALATCRSLVDRGFRVETIPVDGQGRVNLDSLHDLLTHDVLLVSLGLVNSEIGTLQDLQGISDLVRQKAALVHCDASQATCATDLTNVQSAADLVSVSAHKMYGPKGVGALLVNRAVQQLVRPIIHGGGQQLGLRSGTLPTALCVGFGAAADLLCSPLQVEERARITRLRDALVEGLERLPWQIELNNTAENRHPGNANVRFEGFVAADILAVVQPALAASTGSACTSGIPEPSYVLREIGLTYEQASSSIRFCTGRFTTISDVEEAIQVIAGALEQLEINGTGTASGSAA